MRFWVMSKQQLFQKFNKKPQLSFLTLSEGLISQCSFSLSSLNPAADNTFLHSLTTETKHISFPIKTTLFIKSQALSVNECNMQLWWFCCHYQVLSLFPEAPQLMQLDGQLVLTNTSYVALLVIAPHCCATPSFDHLTSRLTKNSSITMIILWSLIDGLILPKFCIMRQMMRFSVHPLFPKVWVTFVSKVVVAVHPWTGSCLDIVRRFVLKWQLSVSSCVYTVKLIPNIFKH